MSIQDKIGRHDIVDKICYLVNNLSQDDNFCLALNGSWGSGKSFVIELLQDKLSKHEEYIVVHYDAWKNNFYSDPLIAMLYSIADTLEKTFFDKKEKRAKKTAVKLVKNAAEDALAEAAKSKGYVGFIARAILKIRNVIKEYKKTALTNDSTFEEYESYANFLHNTVEQLNEITAQKIIKDKQIRFVVFVDEIDRCLPNEQLMVLERMHHLFAIKNCAVIVALNKDVIHKNIDINYGGNGEDYLRKFFQYNFELSANAFVLFKNELIDIFYKINDARKEPIIAKGVDFLINDLVQVAQESVEYINNRDVKKFFNDANRLMSVIAPLYPALIWFALKLLFYRMFSQKHYQMIVEPDGIDSMPITDLSFFYREKIAEKGAYGINSYFRGERKECAYKLYSVGSYNEQLFLFNVCKYRHNVQFVESLAKAIYFTGFSDSYNNVLKILEQVNIIFAEVEHYGTY